MKKKILNALKFRAIMDVFGNVHLLYDPGIRISFDSG